MPDVPPVTPVLFVSPESRAALNKLTAIDSTGRVADPPTVAEVRSALVEADVTGDLEQRDQIIEDARRHHIQHLAAWWAQATERGYREQPQTPADLKAGHAREHRRRMRTIRELETMRRPHLTAATAAAMIEGIQ